MYEKLDKIRADLDRAKQRRAEADARVKQLELRLKEAENNQILADVGALKLTPEQLAQFLQMVSGTQQTAGEKTEDVQDETNVDTEYDYEESEDLEDED